GRPRRRDVARKRGEQRNASVANRYIALCANWRRRHRGRREDDRRNPRVREIVLIQAPELRQILADEYVVRAIGNEVGPAGEYPTKIVPVDAARLACELLEVETDPVFVQVAPDRRSHVMGDDWGRDQLVHIRQ